MVHFKKLLAPFIATTIALTLLISVTGCETMGGPKQTGGTLIGAAGGALLGAQVGQGSGRLIATAIGTFIGAQVGATIGKKMDDEDKRLAGNTAVYTLESQPDNRISRWRNPNNHHAGEFMVTGTTENVAANKVCRDFMHTVKIDGQEEKLYGRACRNVNDAKGAWFVQ